MQLPDGTTLMHGVAPYDPAKAHEYYLKTRKLTGRKPAAGIPVPTNHPSKANHSVTVTVDGKSYKLSAQQLTEQKVYAAQRVAGIKKKLHLLSSELKKKLIEARKADRAAKKPPSAAVKAVKAKDAAKYRDKHKQSLANKAQKTASKPQSTKKPDTTSVQGLKKAIEGVQQNLKAAINRERALSAPTKG